MENFEIRPIIEADLHKLIWDESQEKWRELDQKRYQEVLKGTLLWYVAQVQNEVVGRIKAALEGQTGKPTLFALRVRDDMQHQGIGSALVQAAEEGLREKGKGHVLLSVEQTEEGLRDWYMGMGYYVTSERIDRWSYYVDGQEVRYDLNVIDLEKDL